MWFVLALTAAFLAGSADALAKGALQKSRFQTIAWMRFGVASLFLLPLLFFAPPPGDPQTFWIILGFMLPLEILASLLFHVAIRISPLSLTIPFLAFTPVFLLVMGWLYLKEPPTILGAAGVFCVLIGAFILQPKPRRFIPTEKGPLLMFAVSFLFAVTTAMSKKALGASNLYFFCPVYYGMVALCLALFQGSPRYWPRAVLAQPGLFLALGALEALVCVLQFQAFLMTHAAYVIAVKRLSLLLSVFYGWYFFKESDIRSRAEGTLLMITGAVLIALI